MQSTRKVVGIFRWRDAFLCAVDSVHPGEQQFRYERTSRTQKPQCAARRQTVDRNWSRKNRGRAGTAGHSLSHTHTQTHSLTHSLAHARSLDCNKWRRASMTRRHTEASCLFNLSAVNRERAREDIERAHEPSFPSTTWRLYAREENTHWGQMGKRGTQPRACTSWLGYSLQLVRRHPCTAVVCYRTNDRTKGGGGGAGAGGAPFCCFCSAD